MNDVPIHAPADPDPATFHQWVDDYGPALFRLALSLSGNRLDAEDLCQETFTAGFRGFKTFDGRAAIKTWLTSILIRRAAKLWRKERHARHTLSIHRTANPDDANNHDTGASLADQLSAPSAATAIDQRLDLLQVIRTLPPEFRDALLLREIQGLSYQEIADVLQIPRGTVESRLHRGRAELRQKLTGY